MCQQTSLSCDEEEIIIIDGDSQDGGGDGTEIISIEDSPEETVQILGEWMSRRSPPKTVKVRVSAEGV